MNTKKTIRKILFVAMWLAIGGGMLTLLIAAMGKQQKELCKDYAVTIEGVQSDFFFLDEAAIVNLLKGNVHGNIKGQPRSAFDLQRLEQLLEGNVWIKDAQLYFDNQSVLHISVEEREPVARLFTAGGRSFYIDESRQTLPLSDNMIAEVPVFTGFPDKRKWTQADSVLLQDITGMAQYISKHPFWEAQVAQIDIVTCGPDCWEFEMVPVAGQHLVKLGNGENMENKFRRLLAFYQQMLSRTGMDHYKTIDVRFAGQVVGARSENPKIDSVQARRNVEALIQQASQLNADAMPAGRPAGTTDSVAQVRAVATPPAPATAEQRSERAERRTEQPAQDNNSANRMPRAVMPRRNQNNGNN